MRLGVLGEPRFYFGSLFLRRIKSFAEFRFQLGGLVGLDLFAIRLFDFRNLAGDGLQALFVGIHFLRVPLAFFTGGEVHVLAFGGGEDGLHPVIIGLQDGIELVVVTLGAADGHAEEYRPDGAGHFAQHFLPVCVFVLIAADQMDGAGAMKAGCDQRIVASRVEFIAGDLFLNEQAVGLVPIEAADHIVSVAPGVRAFQVEFVPVGIGIADDIEPALRPALAVVLGFKQAIDHLRIGIGRMVGEEQVDFSGSGRQADEVQRDSAQQALFARQGGRFQILRVDGVQ